MRKLDNNKLDEIGKTLVKAGVVPSQTIDEIVGKPDLFEGVQRRISMAGTGLRPAERRFLRPVTIGFASVVMVAMASFAFVSLRPGAPVDVAVKPPAQQAPTLPPTRVSAEPDQIAPPIPPSEPPAKVVRNAVRTTVMRTAQPKQPVAQHARFVDDFYAVSYAGDPHETERGSRIVRVDIPRSTLFSMGVNVPLENESPTVKADLLIGSDGVTRAIRIVE